MKRTNTRTTRVALRRVRPELLCVAAVFLLAFGMPGGPTEEALAAPPEAPTASLAVGGTAPEEAAPAVGASCLMCHEDTVHAFANTVHGRGDMPAWSDSAGCVACHGDATAHLDSADPADIQVFGAMEPEDANAVCLSCHTQHTQYWRGSVHDMQDVRCTDCHNPHSDWADNETRDHRRITDTCLSCHTNMKKSLFQRSRHPLREGAMSCVSCHSPHGSPTEAAVASIRVNDKCYECHAEARGPFLFDHIPVREDCSTCHNPHGSNQRDLLVQSAPRLCQSCHLFGHHQTVPGQPTQVWNQNNSCVNCHARIHGSNHPSGILFMR